MSNRPSPAEKRVRELLFTRWFAIGPRLLEEGKIALGDSNFRKEYQWMLDNGWVKRERTGPYRKPNARRYTTLVLTAKGRKALEAK